MRGNGSQPGRGGPRSDRFEHIAVLHRGPGDAAQRIVHAVDAATAGGDACLVCVGPPIAAALGGRCDPRSGVSVVDPSVQYARPAAALAAMAEAALAAVTGGASRLTTLWEVPVGATGLDPDWHRYEAAVNDVLGDLSLRALCLYDTGSLPPEALTAVHGTHPLVDTGEMVSPSPSYADTTTPFPSPPRPRPERPPDLEVIGVERPADARHAVEQGVVGFLDVEQAHDLKVVVSELVTNALRHGDTPADLRLWITDDSILAEVTDGGGLLTDPFPDLRPPRFDGRGFGLWLVGQLTRRVGIEVEPGRTTVRAVLAYR